MTEAEQLSKLRNVLRDILTSYADMNERFRKVGRAKRRHGVDSADYEIASASATQAKARFQSVMLDADKVALAASVIFRGEVTAHAAIRK